MAERTLKLTSYQDKNGHYRWRVFGRNGEQLARSPRGYVTYDEMKTALIYILSKNHDAELYKDNRMEWRWRFRDANNKSIGIASEGYKNRGDCKTASDMFLDAEIA